MLVHPEPDPANLAVLEVHRGTRLDETEIDEVVLLVGRLRSHFSGGRDAYVSFDLDRLARLLPVCRETLQRVRGAIAAPDSFAQDDLDAVLRVAYRAAGVFVVV